jgi:hemin uptake protein HemP
MIIIDSMDLQLNTERKQPGFAVSAASHMQRPKVSSLALLGPRGELIIEHGGREYRLRLTQNGKLILTA